MLCNELICSVEQVAFAMPSLVFGPTARLAGTVPPTAAEPQTQEGLLCLLLCLAGQEHNLDLLSSLITTSGEAVERQN